MKKKTISKLKKKKFGWKVTIGKTPKLTKKFDRRDVKIPIRKENPKKYKQKSVFEQDSYFID